MHSAKEIFKNLVGTWKIKRVLGNYGKAEGMATFTISKVEAVGEPLPLELKYREELEVAYNDAQIKGLSGTAHQEYIYHYDKNRDVIVKQFMDGRHFYDLKIDLDKMEGVGKHLCDQDFYNAKYIFGDHDHFTLAYDVKGPHKDYLIETRFVREIIPGEK